MPQRGRYQNKMHVDLGAILSGIAQKKAAEGVAMGEDGKFKATNSLAKARVSELNQQIALDELADKRALDRQISAFRTLSPDRVTEAENIALKTSKVNNDAALALEWAKLHPDFVKTLADKIRSETQAKATVEEETYRQNRGADVLSQRGIIPNKDNQGSYDQITRESALASALSGFDKDSADNIAAQELKGIELRKATALEKPTIDTTLKASKLQEMVMDDKITNFQKDANRERIGEDLKLLQTETGIGRDRVMTLPPGQSIIDIFSGKTKATAPSAYSQLSTTPSPSKIESSPSPDEPKYQDFQIVNINGKPMMYLQGKFYPAK